MMAAENYVGFFIKASGRQEFLDRRVKELYDVSVKLSTIDNGEQSEARTVVGLRNFPASVWIGSCPKIEWEQLP